jgi:NDP-sugar pyrophosphorylase family protein
MYTTEQLFDLTRTAAAELLKEFIYPWDVLGEIGDYIKKLGEKLPAEEYDSLSQDIWVAKDSKVYPSACLNGPCIVFPGAEIRHCAFIRGNVIIGKNAIVGNSTELKNVILFDEAHVPHYNYVGDSILGYRAHMGAGSITSNVKSDNSNIVVYDGSQKAETGRRKIGAMIGDFAEIGCNAVLNPGAIIGRRATVYPLMSVRGTVPEDSIYKGADRIVRKI